LITYTQRTDSGRGCGCDQIGLASVHHQNPVAQCPLLPPIEGAFRPKRWVIPNGLLRHEGCAHCRSHARECNGLAAVTILHRTLSPDPGCWLPERIVIDHGTEFTSKALDQWAYEHKVTLHFITPGRPMENGYIESFHGKFREECLNEHWLLTLDDARETIEDWRLDYNQVRPHSSLGYLTPEEFRMGYANVESKNRFPHSHSPDGDGIIPLLNSTASALTYPD
jgi:hypothetical protein